MKKIFLMSILGMGLLVSCGGNENASEAKTENQEGEKSTEPKETNWDQGYLTKVAGYAIEGYQWEEKNNKIKDKSVNITGDYKPADSKDKSLPKIGIWIFNASGGKYSKIMTKLEEFSADQITSESNNFQDSMLTIAGHTVFQRLEARKDPSSLGKSATLKAVVYHDGLGFKYTIMDFNRKTEEEAITNVQNALVKAIESQPKP